MELPPDIRRTQLLNNLYTKVWTDSEFATLAIDIFHYQYDLNPVYQQYCDLIGRIPGEVKKLEEIPFLPVQLYKSQRIMSGNWKPCCTFTSSSTTGQGVAQNHLRSAEFYGKHATFCFESQVGPLKDYIWYALLPSYLEREDSSLVFMVDYFMKSGVGGLGGFFLDDYEKLIKVMKEDQSGRKKILLGVSYALLDLAQNLRPDLSDVMVMETGGMKGRGREIPRQELYGLLKEGLHVQSVWSEYGMTEMMSQAYSICDGIFRAPPVMKVLVFDLNDPFSPVEEGQQGRLHIIDLGNLDTCCFIATEDLGMNFPDSTFRVLGRTDASETRGCNLLYTGR